MDTYFERLEEIVKRHEQEIDHLNAERNALRQEERNMPVEEFNREYQRIVNYLESETRSLNEAQATLESYHYNYDKSESLINDLRNLRGELSSARDKQDEDEINEEITSKEAELRASISLLPLELADYLRNTFLTRENVNYADDIEIENTNDNVDNLPEEVTPDSLNVIDTQVEEGVSENNLVEEAQIEYDLNKQKIENLKAKQAENNEALEKAIKRINEIMQEERAKYENEGPFDNETLNNLQKYYLGLKTSENEALKEIRKNMQLISRKLQSLEKKQLQIIDASNFAKNFELSYKESKKLFANLKNRKIISNIIKQRNLDEIFSKTNKTEEDKENLRKALEEIREKIVNSSKKKENDKKPEIDVLYGMDEQIKSQDAPRKITMPEESRLAIYDSAKQLPAVIRKNDKEMVKESNLEEENDEPLLLTDGNKIEIPSLVVDPEKDSSKKDKLEKSKKEEKVELKRGLREIIGDLRVGLDMGKKDGSRYRRCNLKVSQNFKKELQSGNTLYNIVHVVPAVIKASTQLLAKISGKIMLGEDAKTMVETLQQRMDNLSYNDLETIFKEYRGNRVNQERYPQVLNMVIEQKISEYILGKVTKINENIERCYRNVFYADNLIKSIDDNLRKGKLSNEEKLARLEQRRECLQRAAESIKYIRKAKIEADNLLSGGLHGLSEDMKAAASKLNCVGMRFTKNHDLDNDLEDALLKCEKAENKAIADGNDELLLNSFIQNELLLSSNTEISYSIFGKRSVGKKYYSPLAEQLNYNNDPFIRDLFTTIAVATSAISAVNASSSFKNKQSETEQFIVSEREMLDKIHKAGEEITSKRNAMYEGMRAQANQDVLTSSGTIERATLDANDWILGTDAYHVADKAGHAFTNDFYNSVQSRFATVSQEYGSSVINQAGVLQELAKISNDSHATLVSVTDKCLEILRPYAQNNPQFDLVAAQDAMQYIVSHPDAIANMNQAMMDVQNIGEELLNVSQTSIETITNLPGDLGSTIMAAASACALASRVSSTMSKTVNKGYGNAVTDMVNEYINDYELQEETKESTHRN